MEIVTQFPLKENEFALKKIIFPLKENTFALKTNQHRSREAKRP